MMIPKKITFKYHRTCHCFQLQYFQCLLSDNCKKLGLVFENVVGIVEIINSKAVQLQVINMYKSSMLPGLAQKFSVTLVKNQLLNS